MADEENQSAEGQAPAVEKEESPKEDFENKYKELQGKYDQTNQELKKVQETLDAVTPYVNWEMTQQQNQEGQEEYLSKKDLATTLKDLNERSENRILELQFRVDHPELKGYEDSLVAPTLVRLRKQHPSFSKERLLNEAAKEVNDFLESERKKGEKKAKEEKAKKEAEEMAGLESGGATVPKEEDAGQTKDEYIAERRKRLEKMKTGV